MAFQHFVYTTQDQGVCQGMRNAGQNGDLCKLLHQALTVGSNWARVYDSGDDKHMIWEPDGGGMVLSVQHDSAVSGDQGLAVVRMAESQSGGVLTDPVPLPTQVADNASNWLISNGQNTTSRDFHIVAWEAGLIYVSRYSSSANVWDLGFCMRGIPRFPADVNFCWFVLARESTNASGQRMASIPVRSNPTTAGQVYALRDVRESLKAEACSLSASGSSLGNVSGTPSYRAGYGNSVDRERVGVHGFGVTSGAPGALAVISRAVLPHIWSPVHSSLTGGNDQDQIQDGASQFKLLRGSSSAGVLLRTTNDEIETYPSS